MNRSRIRSRGALLGAAGAATAALLVAAGQPAQAAPAHTSTRITGNTPSWVASARNLGPASGSQQLHLTVWLNLRNESKLQQQLRALYTKGNASFHHWLTQSQFQSAYSPTSQQVTAVSNYLHAKGLTVGATADNNFYVEASGSVATIDKAFHISVNNYSYRGKSYQANNTDPTVDTAGGGNIAFVDGLNTAGGYQPDIVRSGDAVPNTNPAYDVLCGDMSTTYTLNFNQPPSPRSFTGFIPCGYLGNQLQKAYGVDQVVSNGIDGTGQTVAIVDAYGSPTILTDANAFSAASGLPPLNSSNFSEITPMGTVNKKESRAQDPLGWQAEVTLDVEAVHSMAPGAKIVLVAAPNNYADLDESVNWVVVHHVANIVTNSWGLSTDLSAPGKASRDERIFMQAAAEGIGLDFSSGDNGDESAATGVKSVDYPASSPWVTAIGGTSLFLNQDSSYNFETGWGTELEKLASCASSSPDGSVKHCDTYNEVSPPADLGFQGGAGGGLSYNFTAQPWQSSAIGGDTAAGFGTVGTHRAVPDVSMVADPYTGMKVYITDLSAGDTSPVIEPYGGTSLASPLFAGMSALVDQSRAMHNEGPMGLASQYLYGPASSGVRDVTAPPPGAGNPAFTGDSTSMSQFYGSRYSGSLFNVDFNEDSSLATSGGWDDVTGVGSPYAPAFVNALS